MNESPTPELLSLVLTLRPLAAPQPDRPLPKWWGRAAHTLLLATFNAADPALAARLHDEEGLKPFTTSTLMGRFQRSQPLPGQTYRLRFTALTAELSAALLAAAHSGPLAPGARVELDYLPFEILAAASAEDPTGWPGATTYQDLGARRLLAGSAPERRVTLSFTSPVAFKSKDRTMPLPLPDLVFGSLLQKWNAFAPLALPAELRRYASECLAISRFHLRSHGVGAKDEGLRVGAAGEITYATLNYDRYWMSLIHALGEFARFAGVGAAVSQGMGQARRLPTPGRED